MNRFFGFARKYIRNVDKPLLIFCLLASIYGLVLIYSATFSYNTVSYVRTQAFAIALGILVFFIANMIDYEDIARFWPVFLTLNLSFLATLYFWGVGDSNRSWLRFAGIGIQPAELGKVVFILTFARHLALAKQNGMRIRDVLGLLAHAGVTIAFVIFFSRDDGMSLAYGAIALAMSFFAGVGIVYFLAGATALGIALPYIWNILMDDYQRARILAVFDPEAYPDASYQAMHSRMAIRSGGLLGEGFLSGTQTQYSLIPTKHTDSIFPVAAEEFGLFGAAFILILLLLILVCIVRTAIRAQTDTSALICIGIAAMLAFQTILNLGMNLGIFPIVGLTLPFFSYGGSSILTMFTAAGMVSGIRRQIQTDNLHFAYYIRRYP